MTEQRGRFDWLLFLTCELAILVLAIVWIREELHKHDGSKGILLSIAVFIALTALNYLRSRRANHMPDPKK